MATNDETQSDNSGNANPTTDPIVQKQIEDLLDDIDLLTASLARPNSIKMYEENAKAYAKAKVDMAEAYAKAQLIPRHFRLADECGDLPAGGRHALRQLDARISSSTGRTRIGL